MVYNPKKVSNAKKQKLNIEYEILYNKNFNPKYEIQICYHNPVQNKFVDYDDYFQADPVDDYKKNELENNSDYSCHETRISVWDAEYNAYWLETKSSDFKIEKSIKLFQFVQGPGEWLNDYDKSKIGKLEVTKVNDLLVGDTRDRKEIELDKAKKYETLSEFDEAAEIYKKYGMEDDVIRVREEARNKVSQTVVHGDYVDDRDTIVKDSVINRSNIGNSGKSKSEELREAKALLDDGIIDDDEFKQMKKEILGK